MRCITFLLIALLIMVLLAGCKDAAPIAVTDSYIPLDTSVENSTHAPSPTPVVLEGFPMPLTDGNRLFYYHEGDLTCWTVDRTIQKGLQLYRTDDRGKQWNSVPLPTLDEWEVQVSPDHIQASFHQEGNSWILLQSEPDSNGMVRKTLYRSNQSGEEWFRAADLTEMIGGEVLSMSIQMDGKGFITSSLKLAEVVPFYRTEDMGVNWKPVNLPLKKGFDSGVSYLPYIGSDGRGTVRTDYNIDGEIVTEYLETTDNGASWYQFETTSILGLEGDPDALKVIKKFLDAWQNHDSKVLATLWEGDQFINVYSWMWETDRRIYYYSVDPPSSVTDSSSLIIGARYYVTAVEGEDRTGVMAIGVRKQAGTNLWKVNFLD
ncbi:hypothetical protein PAECIP111891_06967 [Paenibacillus allorhizoplanae]|uniref:Exo-alpha-sialidase n=1 Tax=Paenibacillus allorhizoplanae TaxID=2905648 RepID=A0ABN8HAR6_9BACL|nr:hypothetical protein [Paenibacillus allorhizoplanae]CAH1232197.1 hypothetical protein PAECIP111891_06967 [Paenibacillus allorhizoplanae]